MRVDFLNQLFFERRRRWSYSDIYVHLFYLYSAISKQV